MKRTWLLFGALVLIVLMISCQSVPSSVIGTDTRAGIDNLKDQTKDIASQAAAIDSGVDTVAQDLAALETAAPDALKGDIRAIQAQVTTLAGLTEAHKGVSAGTAKVVADTKNSFEEDMGDVAVLGAEKAAAEIGEQKAIQKSYLFGIIALICIVALVAFLYLKFKP